MKGDAEFDGARRFIEQPGTELVGGKEERRNSQWIGDPDHQYGDRKVAAGGHSGGGRQQHLKWHRDEGEEEPYGNPAGNRVAVQVPQVGILQRLAEEAQEFLAMKLLGFWQESP